MTFHAEHEAESLAEDMREVSHVLKMVSSETQMIIASQYTASRKQFDGNRFLEMDHMLKKSAGWFSILGRDTRYCLGAMLLTHNEEQLEIDTLFQIYRKFVASGFSRSQQTYLAAAMLTCSGGERQLETVLKKTEEIYGLLKKRHYVLTQKGDITLIALLAQLDEDSGALVDREEQYFSELQKHGFRKNDALQSLACMLAFLSDHYQRTLVEKCAFIKEEVRNRGLRLHADCYPAYGTLALLEDAQQTVGHVLDLFSRLKAEKLSLFISKNIYFQTASYLYMATQLQEADLNQKMDPGLIVMADTLIRAQEALAAAAAASAGAAAAAAASGSGGN